MLAEYPKLYKVAIRISFAFIALLCILSYLSWEITVSFLEIEWDIGALLLLASVLYVLMSLEVIKTNERVGLTMFGRPVILLEPGLYYVPWILLQMVKYPRTVIQAQFPGEPEHVIKGDDAVFSQTYAKLSPEERKTFVRPIRITTAHPKNDSALKDAPLNAQMTIEVSFVVRFLIVNVFNFSANIENIESAIRQIRDTGEALLSISISKRTTAEVVEKLQEIKDELEEATKKATKTWGVVIESVSILSPDINHKVAEGLRDATAARATKLKTTTDAEAERDKRRLHGEGDAAAMKAVQKATGVSGKDILVAETAKAAFGNGNIVLAGAQSGVRDVMSSVLGASAALAKQAEKQTNNKGKGAS